MAPGLTTWAKAREDLPPGVDLDAEPKRPFLSPDQIDAEGRRSGSPGAVKISKASRSRTNGHHGRHRGKEGNLYPPPPDGRRNEGQNLRIRHRHHREHGLTRHPIPTPACPLEPPLQGARSKGGLLDNGMNRVQGTNLQFCDDGILVFYCVDMTFCKRLVLRC